MPGLGLTGQSLRRQWFGNVTPETTLGHAGPPECLSFESKCVCSPVVAASYHAPAPSAVTPRFSSSEAAGLRIFFLEGHVGPMNDMLATLHQVIGLTPDNVDGMTFMQGMLTRHAIDKRFFRNRNMNLGLRHARNISQWLTQTKSGRVFTLPNCEAHRCRSAVVNDADRREFARLFGRVFEEKYDAVACNFPTWQCSIFMYVNVAILMRFTHRYDHHLQGRPLSRATRASSDELFHNRSAVIAEEATHVLRHMATLSKVVFAASNAYDWVYLRRNLGVEAVPWPGLSVQLAHMRYTGGSAAGRKEVLFCCGAQPYNKPIAQWAALVVNASLRLRPKRHGLPTGVAGEHRYAWLNDLYPKSFHCKRVKVANPNNQSSKKMISEEQCGYRYEDVASHPLAVLLPYSVHSYGLVQAYSMGLPIVAPSLKLLSGLHARTGVMGHKGPGNVPWRSTREKPLRTWFLKAPGQWYIPDVAPGAPCCSNEPNDACSSRASAAWLQFADWYIWPHVQYYSTPQELVDTVDILIKNATLRNSISASQKAFFAAEMTRTEGHVRVAMKRALDAVRAAKAR